jgi:hypothetical protein
MQKYVPAFHPGKYSPGMRGERSSGIASGHVEAAKYVVFPDITAVFFPWFIAYFHEKHLIPLL